MDDRQAAEDAPEFRPERIAPPVPAPYLAGVPQLPDELLEQCDGRRGIDPAAAARARQIIDKLRVLIRRARALHEKSIGSVIVPEEPWRP